MKLSVPQGDGASLRAHLQSAYWSTRELDPLLEEALQELPRGLRPLWDAYEAIAATRRGLAPVTHLEIEAWQRLQGVVLTPWEVDSLLAMDQAALAAVPQRKTS